MTKTLLDYCEPFFQEVCALLRSAGDGSVGFESARNRLKDCLAEIQNQVRSATGTIQQDFFGSDREDQRRPGVESALWYFADDVIANSQLAFAADWENRTLANELGGIVNGKTQFYLDLEEVQKKDNLEAARYRLAVYYTCLCLGFSGMLRDQPREVRERVARLYGYLGDLIDRDASKPMCPDAYKTDETILYRPVRESITAIGALLGVLLVATLCAYYFLYRAGVEDLSDTLQQLTRSTTNAIHSTPPRGDQ